MHDEHRKVVNDSSLLTKSQEERGVGEQAELTLDVPQRAPPPATMFPGVPSCAALRGNLAPKATLWVRPGGADGSYRTLRAALAAVEAMTSGNTRGAGVEIVLADGVHAMTLPELVRHWSGYLVSDAAAVLPIKYQDKYPDSCKPPLSKQQEQRCTGRLMRHKDHGALVALDPLHSGLPGKPLVIRAENPGKAILTFAMRPSLGADLVPVTAKQLKTMKDDWSFDAVHTLPFRLTALLFGQAVHDVIVDGLVLDGGLDLEAHAGLHSGGAPGIAPRLVGGVNTQYRAAMTSGAHIDANCRRIAFCNVTFRRIGTSPAWYFDFEQQRTIPNWHQGAYTSSEAEDILFERCELEDFGAAAAPPGALAKAVPSMNQWAQAFLQPQGGKPGQPKPPKFTLQDNAAVNRCHGLYLSALGNYVSHCTFANITAGNMIKVQSNHLPAGRPDASLPVGAPGRGRSSHVIAGCCLGPDVQPGFGNMQVKVVHQPRLEDVNGKLVDIAHPPKNVRVLGNTFLFGKGGLSDQFGAHDGEQPWLGDLAPISLASPSEHEGWLGTRGMRLLGNTCNSRFLLRADVPEGKASDLRERLLILQGLLRDLQSTGKEEPVSLLTPHQKQSLGAWGGKQGPTMSVLHPAKDVKKAGAPLWLMVNDGTWAVCQWTALALIALTSASTKPHFSDEGLSPTLPVLLGVAEGDLIYSADAEVPPVGAMWVIGNTTAAGAAAC